MQRAVYLKQTDDFSIVSDYDRLYMGAEFCEKRLPSLKAVKEAAKAAKACGAGFSLVTPYVSESGLARLGRLIAGLPDVADIEVIVNDYGTLMFLRRERPDLEPILGRLLAKQKKGFGISTRKEDAPPALVNEWRHSAFDNSETREYLKELGIKRVELDNLIQGIDADFAGSGLSASIYYLFAVATTSVGCRFCGTAPSGPGCLQGMIEEKEDLFDRPVYSSGNARFFRNDDLPAEDKLAAMGIDRIIYQPEIPV